MNEAHETLLRSIESNTSAAIDTKNGLQCQPGAIANFGPVLVEGGNSATYSAGRGLLKHYAETLTAMRAADDAVRLPIAGTKMELSATGKTRNSVQPDKVEAYNKSLDIAFGRAGQAHDKARLAIATSLDALNSEIAGKLKDPKATSADRVSENAQARATIHAMKPGERTAAVAELIKAGDLPTVSALLHASSFVTGLDTKSLGILKSLAETQFAGPIALRRDATQKVLAHVDAASADFVSRFSQFKPANNPRNAAHALEALAAGK